MALRVRSSSFFRQKVHRSWICVGSRLASTKSAPSLNPLQIDTQAKHFNYNEIEEKMFKWWEDYGFMNTTNSEKLGSNETFCIPMPPPNVTGSLHIGHALGLAIQDALIRYNRLKGKNVVWIPGTDHAGIATQLQVEKMLEAEGTSRKMLGRDAFVKRILQWKDEKGGYIVAQMKRLGASADWSREQFTLSEPMSEAVTEAFVQLYNRGLIYKGTSLVNWCPKLQTAVSDLEIEHSDENGFMYYIRYPLHDSPGYIPVATTRPETLFGDTAICVHPEDERYQHLVGQFAKVPFVDRKIPIVADPSIRREFGSGALKVTPAHDLNDYVLAQRHGLPALNIFDTDASLNSVAGQYAGLSREKARRQVWSDLVAAGIGERSEKHVLRVPRSQRGGAVIEPRLSQQWFVRTSHSEQFVQTQPSNAVEDQRVSKISMAERALQSANSGNLNIVPNRFTSQWTEWMENMHDWCISRQLWWGHRLPVYYINGDHDKFVVARSEPEALQIARAQFGENVALEQEEDVLDTWFSSGLWPFAILGWPKELDKRLYPTSLLVTGYDILFFWVARMVILGLELTNRVPFDVVYLHGLVRDANGQKMSKTRGNVVDPLSALESHGCDALRHSLLGALPAQGQDLHFSEERLENGKHFVNKLWNIGKFVGAYSLQTNISHMNPDALRVELLPVPERAVLAQLRTMLHRVTLALDAFRLAEALNELHEFIWNDFASWYLEISKTRSSNSEHHAASAGTCSRAQQTNAVLLEVWGTCVIALHPFMPFVSEALWQALRQLPLPNGSIPIESDTLMLLQEKESVMTARWPRTCDPTLNNDRAVILMDTFRDIVVAVRNIRAQYRTDRSKKVAVTVQLRPSVHGSLCSELEELLVSEVEGLALLAGVDPKQFKVVKNDVNQDVAGSDSATAVIRDDVQVWVPLGSLIDVNAEMDRLKKGIIAVEKEICSLRARLDSDDFRRKAPMEVVQETKTKYEDKVEILKSMKLSVNNYLKSD